LHDQVVHLRPGDALVLYTDGLTDAYAPERILTPEDVAGALQPCRARPAAEIARAVPAVLLGSNGRQARDDMALLVLSVPPIDAGPHKGVLVHLRVETDAVPTARRAIKELEPSLEPELFEKVALLVSELVTNAVRHASAPASATIELRAEAFGDRARVEVSDRGPGFEPRRRTVGETSPSGWGLYLVDQLSDRWGVSRTGGTTVWLEIDRGVPQPR
jgi:anti-sigma regulatory factor (Ser/Thr protein kinase)